MILTIERWSLNTVISIFLTRVPEEKMAQLALLVLLAPRYVFCNTNEFPLLML